MCRLTVNCPRSLCARGMSTGRTPASEPSQISVAARMAQRPIEKIHHTNLLGGFQNIEHLQNKVLLPFHKMEDRLLQS